MIKKYHNSYLSYFLMYNFYFLSWALFSTLISVYLLDKGYRPSQVSLVVSISFFASMIAQPFLGILNDRFKVKQVITISFILTLVGAGLFLLADNLYLYALSYSLVLLLINGANPVLEQLATSSHFAYGKLRIWGTIGYAVGSQMAGLIYDHISPEAIYVTFIFTMLLAILGVLGTAEQKKHNAPKKSDKHDNSAFKTIFQNKIFILYLLMSMVYSGVMNTGHTYIPAMLESSGLSVGLATTVVSLAVLCESPLTLLSYLFMDKFKSKQLLYVSVLAVTVQYLVYAINVNLPSMVLVTLVAKHAAGMLYIMVNMKIVSSLIDPRHLLTALALVQTGRNLGSIVFQNIAGAILDRATYSVMCWGLVTVLIVVLISVHFLKLPSGTDQKLFS